MGIEAGQLEILAWVYWLRLNPPCLHTHTLPQNDPSYVGPGNWQGLTDWLDRGLDGNLDGSMNCGAAENFGEVWRIFPSSIPPRR
jgi:hypothetical protein